MGATATARNGWIKILREPRFFGGIVLLTAMILAALMGPSLAPYALEGGDYSKRFCTPSAENFLGCDGNGNDVLTAMLFGARTTLYVGFLTVVLSVLLGVSLGLIAGYFRGAVDLVIMRLVDMIMAFPGILLAMAMAALMGPSLNNVILAITITGWTSSARLVRGQVLSLTEREYVVASKALGAKHRRVILQHIFPGTLSPLIVHATFSLSGVIIIEASLSFLGLGAQDGAPTWGALLGQGKNAITQAPHLSLVPGFAIMVIVLALNFMGDALRDFLDPRDLH